MGAGRSRGVRALLATTACLTAWWILSPIEGAATAPPGSVATTIPTSTVTDSSTSTSTSTVEPDTTMTTTTVATSTTVLPIVRLSLGLDESSVNYIGEYWPGEWSLRADGSDGNDLVGRTPTVAGVLRPDAFALSVWGPPSEDPNAFVFADWTCTGGDLDGTVLTLTAGESASCSVTVLVAMTHSDPPDAFFPTTSSAAPSPTIPTPPSVRGGAAGSAGTVELAATGASTTPLVMLAVALLSLGALATGLARRTR